MNNESIDVREFIPQAERNSKTNCPMALALKAHYDAGRVEVDGSRLKVFEKDGSLMFEGQIGKDMSDAIKRYDETGEWDGDTRFYCHSGFELAFAVKQPEIGTYQRK